MRRNPASSSVGDYIPRNFTHRLHPPRLCVKVTYFYSSDAHYEFLISVGTRVPSRWEIFITLIDRISALRCAAYAQTERIGYNYRSAIPRLIDNDALVSPTVDGRPSVTLENILFGIEAWERRERRARGSAIETGREPSPVAPSRERLEQSRIIELNTAGNTLNWQFPSYECNYWPVFMQTSRKSHGVYKRAEKSTDAMPSPTANLPVYKKPLQSRGILAR